MVQWHLIDPYYCVRKHQRYSVKSFSVSHRSSSHVSLSLSPSLSIPLSVNMNLTILQYQLLSLIIPFAMAYFSQHGDFRAHPQHGMPLKLLLLSGRRIFHYPSPHFVYPPRHLTNWIWIAAASRSWTMRLWTCLHNSCFFMWGFECSLGKNFSS